MTMTMTEQKVNLTPGVHNVQIRRKEGSSHIPVEIRQESEQRLSSVFENGQVYVGVDRDIIDFVMPMILDEVEGTPEYRKKAQEFWADVVIKVGSEGTVLDASVNEYGVPVNPREFLYYKWAMNHPLVAQDKLEMERAFNKRFYIHDPEVETRKKNALVKLRASAMREFVKVIENEESTDMILRVLGNKNPVNMTPEQKQNQLNDLVDADPGKFLKIATDDTLKYKSFINQLLDTGILRRSGNTHFYMDEALGTMDETIAFIKQKSNSSTVSDMKAKLKEVKVG